ncbi:hypothetical protein Riv7116_6568 [Rivularia sp. PCC 7116]|uniref:hypothetical protein n=1 Tax=Rivularia sp. PCC 7116 TaxID=373994 RepID=UPI00029EF826|nr:hypothetical protein [Rivularia sp. PCC 7116]AFY58895.1 hypothetical protein Riv7116_6568 [Rivularia sp. PCC 7116]
MKSGLIFKGLLLTTLIAVIGISLKLFNDNRVKQANRAEFCSKAKALTQVKVDKYDKNGIKEREGAGVKIDGGTFYRQVSFKSKPVVPVVIFPEALDGKKWSKVPSAAITYIGKGGDGSSLQEWLSPDYFYLLEVPEAAKGLAFGRLCYKNGDATVYSIRNWKQLENNKISINNKITLEHPTPLPKINPAHILVNASSSPKDSLKDATQVYFTKQRVRIPQNR